MKLSFTTRELASVESIITKVGVETVELQCILSSVDEDITVSVKPGDLQCTSSLSLETRNRINEKYGHVLTITKFENEYQLYICEDFFCETMNLYGDGIVEVMRGLQGMAKSMIYFVTAKFRPFLAKWKL